MSNYIFSDVIVKITMPLFIILFFLFTFIYKIKYKKNLFKEIKENIHNKKMKKRIKKEQQKQIINTRTENNKIEQIYAQQENQLTNNSNNQYEYEYRIEPGEEIKRGFFIGIGFILLSITIGIILAIMIDIIYRDEINKRKKQNEELQQSITELYESINNLKK